MRQGEFVLLNRNEWVNRLDMINALSERERIEVSKNFKESVFNIEAEVSCVIALCESLINRAN